MPWADVEPVELWPILHESRGRPVSVDHRVEYLLRELAPQVLGALVRRHGHFDVCEDATQEAMLQASMQWSAAGVPDNPRGWLVTVASRLLRHQPARAAAPHRARHATRQREE